MTEASEALIAASLTGTPNKYPQLELVRRAFNVSLLPMKCKRNTDAI
jgi:hypothetical protein